MELFLYEVNINEDTLYLTFTFCTNHGIQRNDQKVPLYVPWYFQFNF